MSYCCITQSELAESGSCQRREARKELDCVWPGFCWGMCGLGYSLVPEQVQTELLCSALFSFEPVSSTTVSLCSQTESVYKMSRVHCCSPLNSPRKCIWEQAFTGCYSDMVWFSISQRLIWLRQGKNTRHKAGTQRNPEQQFILPRSSYKPDPQI